jgi:hypothetical protein
MGIITEGPRVKAERTLLDNIDLVRTKPHPDSPSTEAGGAAEGAALQTMTSGGETLTLTDRCVIHRRHVSRHRVATIIPLRSIDSFGIQTRRSDLLLAVATTLLLAASFVVLWSFLVPMAKAALFSSAAGPVLSGSVWLPVLLATGGLVMLLAYSSHARAEVVISSRSGRSEIRVKLSRKIESTLQQFVEDIEAQIPKD